MRRATLWNLALILRLYGAVVLFLSSPPFAEFSDEAHHGT
jgi:hypothetical protein